MTVKLSYRELFAIASTRQHVAMDDRGERHHRALVVSFVQSLVRDECDAVIRHRASLLPPGCHTALRSYLAELATKNYFERVFVIGPGYTEEQQRAFQPRFRFVAEQLAQFLQNPVAPTDMPPADIDLFWAYVVDTPRRAGITCRRAGCSEEAIQLSVFCPQHHYLQIKGCSPPT